MPEPTTLWTLTNEHDQTISCSIHEHNPQTFLVVVVLDAEEVQRETHYTLAAAISRARSLRDSLMCRNWKPTS